MIVNHPIYGHNYSYHIRGDRSPLKWLNKFNHLSPRDALKHHFTSLKTDLILLQPRDLKNKFP